ncbi:MAG TPA: PQQ-binding-like beta-propeller repeat protein [Kofleriaceae bacterium]|nr:PQQ-binding-like beta-propeller repeat protein [Kofleriaceae bacterium]
MRVLPLLGVLAACGAPESDRSPEPAPPPATTPEPPAPRPAPGLDLSGPIAPADPGAPAPRKPAVPLELTADRAIVKVSVPIPPHGGAVGFTFADDRPGWVARIPDSRQLPAVAYGQGKIFVSGGFESVSFYALDATTGHLEWATTALEDNGPTAPVIDGDDVLFNTESCTLFALDARTGKRRWFHYLGDPTLAQIAVADGVVYSAHPDADTGGPYALSAFRVKSGTRVWSRALDGELLVTPVIAGDAVYASTLAGSTYRFDRKTGKLVWRRALQATTAPWVAGEELFVSRRRGGKEQQIVVDTATGKVLREHTASTGSYFADVPVPGDDWKKIWAFEGSRPVVDHGVRYVAMGSDVHASDANNGEAIWHRRYDAKSGARQLGSVALAGSTLVTATRDGKVFGLDVDTGFTLWSYDIGHRMIAEPVIAQGWLYAPTEDGYVVALNVADKSLDGWHMFGGNPQKNGAIQPVVPPPVEGVPPPAPPATTTSMPTTGASIADGARDQLTVMFEQARDAEIAATKARRLEPVKLQDDCLTNVFCE